MNNKTLKYKEATPVKTSVRCSNQHLSQPLTLEHHPRTLRRSQLPQTFRSHSLRPYFIRFTLQKARHRHTIVRVLAGRGRLGATYLAAPSVPRSPTTSPFTLHRAQPGPETESLGDRRPSRQSPRPSGPSWILDHAVPLILASTAPLALDAHSSRPHVVSSVLFRWTMTPQPQVVKHLMYIPAAAAAAAPTCFKNHQTKQQQHQTATAREPSPEQLAAAKHPLQRCRSPRHARHPDPPTARPPALLISQRLAVGDGVRDTPHALLPIPREYL